VAARAKNDEACAIVRTFIIAFCIRELIYIYIVPHVRRETRVALSKSNPLERAPSFTLSLALPMIYKIPFVAHLNQ
jgi:hypothetical protein